MPIFPVQYYTIMRNGDVMAIDGVVVQAFLRRGPGFQVDDELMAVQIEVDPLIGAPAFFAAKDIAVKSAGFVEIINGNGYVKGRDLFHAGGFAVKNTTESPNFRTKFLL